jgi:uncharacterized membrane protein YfcA
LEFREQFFVMLQFIVSGALVGFIVGATGVGGGSLMTPLLTLAFGVPAQIAVGTDLLFAAVTKSSGGFAFARRGQVPWSIVGWLALGSLPASLATLGALNVWHPNSVQFGALVRPCLGFALLLTASALIFRSQIQALGRRFSSGTSTVATSGNTIALGGMGGIDSPNAHPIRTIAIGALIGTLVTLTSVGAGAIGVVALFFLYPALPARELIGADIVHAVPLTLIAGLGHAALGTVDWVMLAGLLIGSLPAIHLGAAIANRLPERVLRLVLAAMLIVVAMRLFWV